VFLAFNSLNNTGEWVCKCCGETIFEFSGKGDLKENADLSRSFAYYIEY